MLALPKVKLVKVPKQSPKNARRLNFAPEFTDILFPLNFAFKFALKGVKKLNLTPFSLLPLKFFLKFKTHAYNLLTILCAQGRDGR